MLIADCAFAHLCFGKFVVLLKSQSVFFKFCSFAYYLTPSAINISPFFLIGVVFLAISSIPFSAIYPMCLFVSHLCCGNLNRVGHLSLVLKIVVLFFVRHGTKLRRAGVRCTSLSVR